MHPIHGTRLGVVEGASIQSLKLIEHCHQVPSAFRWLGHCVLLQYEQHHHHQLELPIRALIPNAKAAL
jgi:hypothetical protein